MLGALTGNAIGKETRFGGQLTCQGSISIITIICWLYTISSIKDKEEIVKDLIRRFA